MPQGAPQSPPRAPLQVAFLGAGNIARCLLDGLIAGGFAPASFCASDPDAGQLAKLAARHPGLVTTGANRAAVEDCDVAFACVKPGAVEAVCRDVADVLARRDALMISVAAGVPLALLDAWSGARLAVIRCMPNTPVAAARGVAALCAGVRVSAAQRARAEALLGAAAVTAWIDEEQLDLVTALSGSGPAYFFRVTEAFAEAATKLGLAPDVARRLAVATFGGAAALADAAGGDVAALRRQVTSPGGTTERGLAQMEQAGIAKMAEAVLAAGAARAAQIAAEVAARDAAREEH